MNTLRLLSEFHQGSLTLADTWRGMFAPENAETVLVLAREAGKLVDAARAKLGMGGSEGRRRRRPRRPRWPRRWPRSTSRTTSGRGSIYDLVICARSDDPPIETLVAALVPVYFGRVGSFVIENRDMTTEQAEDRVERQAREFELLKPYLVERWRTAVHAAEAAGAPA